MFRKIALIVAACFAVAASAQGVALNAPAALYQGPSAQAGAMFVLSNGYPLRQISSVDGWRKVILNSGETGWIRAALADELTAAIVTAELAAVRSSNTDNAPPVFYARKGVTLTVLMVDAGWAQVSHADGETGYVALSDLWLNH